MVLLPVYLAGNYDTAKGDDIQDQKCKWLVGEMEEALLEVEGRISECDAASHSQRGWAQNCRDHCCFCHMA